MTLGLDKIFAGLIGILLLAYVAAIMLPLTFGQIADTNVTAFPAGTAPLWQTVFPLLILFGVVLAGYGYVKFGRGMGGI